MPLHTDGTRVYSRFAPLPASSAAYADENMLTLDDHTPPSWGTRQCQGGRRRVQVMPSSGGARPASGRQAGKPRPVSYRRATHRTPAGDRSLHYRRRAGPPQTRAILSRTNIDLQHRRAEGEPGAPPSLVSSVWSLALSGTPRLSGRRERSLSVPFASLL